MKLTLTILLFISLDGYGQSGSVPMKEYVDMRNELSMMMFEQNRDWNIRYNDAQLQALKEANELVRLALNEYKTVNNEWRGVITDMGRNYITTQTFFSTVGALGVIIGLMIAYMNFKKNEGAKFREGTKDDKIKKTPE